MEYVLQTKDLTKTFSNKLAVNKVSINVRQGDIYGFIGKNGAGKTTLIRMVAGLASADEGSIALFESDELASKRRKIGTMIENPAVFPNMTAKENLKFYCLLLGISPEDNIDKMLNLVRLEDTGRKKAKNFSLGMKQRLAIAIALLDNPDLLLLDEPVNGLDPTGIREVRELILRLNKERQITILISSHILGELSKIANRYGVINDGILIDEFTNSELEKRVLGEIEVKVDDINKALAILSNSEGVPPYRVLDANTIRLMNVDNKSGLINSLLVKNDVTVSSISVVGRDLEAYFLQLMEQRHN